MSESFTFEIVSPEKVVFSKPIAMATIPGGEGDYGILPGHAPLITTVRAGVIEIYADATAAPSERIFVAGGFAETTQSRCTVLAEEATPVANLNRAKLEEQAKDIASKLASASDANRADLLGQQEIVTAKMQAAA